VVEKFSFDKVDFHDASPPSSSTSAAVVSGCACGANSEGASGSRGTVAAAVAAGAVGLLALDGFEVFLRASSRAAFAAASISALAEARVV
jgi:broad specificity polyphosphatase/5'/3'-nucleotidase SurE